MKKIHLFDNIILFSVIKFGLKFLLKLFYILFTIFLSLTYFFII